MHNDLNRRGYTLLVRYYGYAGAMSVRLRRLHNVVRVIILMIVIIIRMIMMMIMMTIW